MSKRTREKKSAKPQQPAKPNEISVGRRFAQPYAKARLLFDHPHSPMVCVKLPKTVLVLFHLFRATKFPVQVLLVVTSGEATVLCMKRLRFNCALTSRLRHSPLATC